MLFKENSQDFLTVCLFIRNDRSNSFIRQFFFILQRLWSNPYATALTGFGKVTNFLQDHVVPALLDLNQLDVDEQRDAIKSLMELKKAEDRENLHVTQDAAGFEFVTKVKKEVVFTKFYLIFNVNFVNYY